jgi:DNA polymerase/3'-5' exonuclease PolX
MSKNKEIAEIFSKMADIMEFLGENTYRINTYRRVAEVLSELGVDVEELVKSWQDTPNTRNRRVFCKQNIGVSKNWENIQV